jgi:hypothetical protein
MRMSSWQAVAPLLAVLLFLAFGLPTVTGRPGPAEGKKSPPKKPFDAGGCVGKVCPVWMYAQYETYCSYYAEYCTGDPTLLFNVSIDDTNCNLPCTPPYCDTMNCGVCIDIPALLLKKDQALARKLVEWTKSKKLKIKSVPSRFYYCLANHCMKGLDKVGDSKRTSPLPNPNPATTTQVSRSLVDLEIDSAGDKTIRVLLFQIMVDPYKETDIERLQAAKKLKMKAKVFGVGQEVDTDPNDTPEAKIPYANIRESSTHAWQVIYENEIYQVIVHKDTKKM